MDWQPIFKPAPCLINKNNPVVMGGLHLASVGLELNKYFKDLSFN